MYFGGMSIVCAIGFRIALRVFIVVSNRAHVLDEAHTHTLY
jgi:hypothetical protein